MARSQAQACVRQRELLAMLSSGGSLSTSDMAMRLGTSEMTIRRDLAALEQSGAAIRCYGGVRPAGRISFEFAFDQRHQRHLDAKQRIGAAGAELVREGQTVLLDTGTTTLEIARCLAKRPIHCRVVTSSLVIASELWAREHVDLLLLGGRVRQGSPDLAGPLTEMMLETLTADVAFLGSEGVDLRRGSFAGDLESARVAARMMASARKAVVVADASKLGHAGLARYAKLNEIDALVTDGAAPGPVRKALKAAGIEVVVVCQ